MSPALGRRVSGPSFVFGGTRYAVGETYSYDDLPPRTRRDILAQREEIEARFGHDPKALRFLLVIVSHADLVRILNARYGERLALETMKPAIQALVSSIARHGLQYPPVGEEGWDRALAAAYLDMDLPYFEVLEPLEMPSPAFIPTLEGAGKEGEELPPPMAKEMREGFWRMMQRVSLGIPGFVGSGEIQGEPPGSQFVGGLAGMRTAWLLRPFGMQLFETVPLVGFYLFGQIWPQVIRVARITRGKSDNWSKVAERLEKEFGKTVEYDLMRGTVPFPQKGASMGAHEMPIRIKPWSRCGNTLFWRWMHAPPVDRPMTVHINPVDLGQVAVLGEPEGMPEGGVLIVQRGVTGGAPHAWSSQEFHDAMGTISPLLSGAVAVWFNLLSDMETRGASREDVIRAFVRLTQPRVNAILTGIEELLASGALPTAERRRLVVREGSRAHQELQQTEAAAAVNEPTVLAPSFDPEAVVDEVLSTYGVVEC